MRGCRNSSISEVFLLLLLLPACGASVADFRVRETEVVIRSDAAFTSTADFPMRVESTLDAALAYWGGTWRHLAGVTITFEGQRHVACGDRLGATGCFDGDIRVSTRDAGFTFLCVEETVLVHEVGHAVIGDRNHLDARWMDFTSVFAQLDGRRGYSDEGEVACPIFVSVWRHPPAR